MQGLCSGCLLLVALRGPGPEPSDTDVDTPVRPPPPYNGGNRPPPPYDGGNDTSRPQSWKGILGPSPSGVSAEFLRQAARRLGVASFGIALASAITIIVNNLVAAAGWSEYSHLALLNVVGGTMVAVSAAVAWMARTGALSPQRLLVTALGYELAIATMISISDHLEPMPTES